MNLEPITAVWVRLDALFPPVPEDQRSVVIDGLDLTGQVPGWLCRWVRSGDGAWVGEVNYRIRHVDGREHTYPVRSQLVPAHALRPRDLPPG